MRDRVLKSINQNLNISKAKKFLKCISLTKGIYVKCAHGIRHTLLQVMYSQIQKSTFVESFIFRLKVGTFWAGISLAEKCKIKIIGKSKSSDRIIVVKVLVQDVNVSFMSVNSPQIA